MVYPRWSHGSARLWRNRELPSKIRKFTRWDGWKPDPSSTNKTIFSHYNPLTLKLLPLTFTAPYTRVNPSNKRPKTDPYKLIQVRYMITRPLTFDNFFWTGHQPVTTASFISNNSRRTTPRPPFLYLFPLTTMMSEVSIVFITRYTGLTTLPLITEL